MNVWPPPSPPPPPPPPPGFWELGTMTLSLPPSLSLLVVCGRNVVLKIARHPLTPLTSGWPECRGGCWLSHCVI